MFQIIIVSKADTIFTSLLIVSGLIEKRTHLPPFVEYQIPGESSIIQVIRYMQYIKKDSKLEAPLLSALLLCFMVTVWAEQHALDFCPDKPVGNEVTNARSYCPR